MTYGKDGVHVGAAQQSFGVHMRVQELAAVWLQLPDGIDRCHRQHRAPAVYRHMPAATVHRGDHPLGPDRPRKRAGEVQIHCAVTEEGRADNDRVGTAIEHGVRALDASDAPSDATGKAGANRGHERRVIAVPFGGIQIDQLHTRKTRESHDPRLGIRRFDRERFALHELHNAPALQIDLQGGRIVQLVQGETLAIETSDPEPWIVRFARFPRVQLIDLDAAKGDGDNAPLVAAICARLPFRVGGGIRSIERAHAVLDGGAHAVIVSSALFRDGAVDLNFARTLAGRSGPSG